ncbi:homoserine acetyltransferase [Saitoella complicata NRRL Y-17804]|nr:homoserine acetyltransferase [Saitoella complicata NRRL Y-17804]ODQ49784.1 homoserine acetyltransferase [Saitoella complicata NRRL Y-17804]
MSFPCLDALESRTATLSNKLAFTPPELTSPDPTSSTSSTGTEGANEPSYGRIQGGYKTYEHKEPYLLDHGGILPGFKIAYETWGELNADRSNAILLHTGLSASSHAKSHPENPKAGWWERFIGPGKALDTNKFFVICTNVLGGCYGSTGPSSHDPSTDKPYGTTFPILTVWDMVRAQYHLLDHLGIDTLWASVGSSMGGMQVLAAGILGRRPDGTNRVSRIVSISGCARSHPYSIALRFTQRQVLMSDPNWSRGFYYDKIPPHIGMKLAREIATITYRSGPEWELRFGRQRADESKSPALCPDFRVETYLDHQGEKFCLEYDANSLLYVSKAMDLFDVAQKQQEELRALRAKNADRLAFFEEHGRLPDTDEVVEACTLTPPAKPYQDQPIPTPQQSATTQSTSSLPLLSPDLVAGLAPLRQIPTLVLGVQSDILFPAWQQREIADALKSAGNRSVTHVELSERESMYGHDSFLLLVEEVGGGVKRFLESSGGGVVEEGVDVDANVGC